MALFTATPARRRLIMIALLLLAISGAVIRQLAPERSTLHDVGTLLLVMWLPAVGNLLAYLIRKIPRRAPRVPDFAPGSTFAPQLEVQLDLLEVPGHVLAALDPADCRCIVLVGQQGFTARLAQPVVPVCAGSNAQSMQVELLRPAAALPVLAPGTDFYLLAGTTAVAKGRVLQVTARAPQPLPTD